MMKLVSMLGNWLMERFIKEKMPKMAMATNTKAVVTGLFTAVLCKLIFYCSFFSCVVIASGARQSRNLTLGLDCFVPRNDAKRVIIALQ